MRTPKILGRSARTGENVRNELDGETHDLSVAVAEQISRDLDAAIEALRSDQDEDVDDGGADYDLDDEFVEVLTSVDGLGPTIAKRLEERFDSLGAIVDASDDEMERLGPKNRMGYGDFRCYLNSKNPN